MKWHLSHAPQVARSCFTQNIVARIANRQQVGMKGGRMMMEHLSIAEN